MQDGSQALLSLRKSSSKFLFGWHEISRSESERRHANPEQGSQFCEIDGIRIHYRDQGQGRPLLLLHGICDSLHTWDPWTEILKEDYRVLRFDLPGFGLSSLPESGLTAELYTNLIFKFLNQMKVSESVVMVGNSLGGYVASAFAAAHPERTAGLALLAPGGFPMDRYPWPIEVANIPVLRSLFQRMTPKHIVLKTVAMLFGDKKAIQDEMVDRWLDLTRTQGNRSSYFRIFRFIKKFVHEYPGHLKTIKCPTLLMWGTHDPWLPLEHAGLWQREIPHLQIKLYPHCGHMPQLEIPAQSASDFDKFICGLS